MTTQAQINIANDSKSAPTAANTLAGLKATPGCRALLDACTARKDYTIRLGSELHGVQLKNLNDQQLEDLARFVADRGVVFFRDQELTEQEHLAFGSRLGPLHVHPLNYGKKDTHPAVVPIVSNENSKNVAGEVWHSDVSSEPAPPAYSILYMEKVPPAGGDTCFASAYAAYEKLSDTMQNILEDKYAIHTNAVAHASIAKLSGANVQREFEYSRHPIVRTHAVSGLKALFVNQGFTTSIVGLHKEESTAILNHLFDVISKGADIQIRFKWEANSVAIWDNRAVQHQAVWDYYPHARKGRRVTVVGEKPIHDVNGLKQSEALGGLQPPPIWSRHLKL
ncbi:hypothetical protein SmJEL517_g02908 [Synchytrium microbalum]|uniref:TauD/TfdA-like domain-containing protein n=1 Tax=Synchytrium microbalum TaxID=1806994 RepID=A0A507C4W5_9FUNG|nr:uncharacterized protein SmJEL517_g02908 [Synchytrium microbalum]TPX34521.1 hypothetical protein SmJEL517_g02908 [Synchytrium microbalum]